VPISSWRDAGYEIIDSCPPTQMLTGLSTTKACGRGSDLGEATDGVDDHPAAMA
jgi:hypothetical protein